MIYTDTHVFFYGGPFSNWAGTPFKSGGIRYNTSEQYMMHKKALVFEDFHTAEKILRSTSPRDQKALGRGVEGYNDEHWALVRLPLVVEGLVDKFTSTMALRQQLLTTDKRIIVEASPTDRIWGIGLGLDNPLIYQPESWRGKNLLGEALMQVRNRIA